MSDPTTEKPEDKDLQDHTFGQKIAEKTEQAERGEADPTGESDQTEHHAGGKA